MSDMRMKEAMKARHTVRRFLDKPISDEKLTLLLERIEHINAEQFLNMKLIVGDDDGFGILAKMIGKGACNYLILAGPAFDDLDERLGYWGADVMLFAQTLGLNTWWIGGMFKQGNVVKHLDEDSLKVSSIIGVGYGANQGKPHKMKSALQISSYVGEEPQWFRDGVEAVLLAPTAINRMAYSIVGDGRKVTMSYAPGMLSGVDLGIGKYHFELGAGKENFDWA